MWTCCGWCLRRGCLVDVFELWTPVVQGAASRFGYSLGQVALRLYVSKFAGKTPTRETRVREWCSQRHVGGLINRAWPSQDSWRSTCMPFD